VALPTLIIKNHTASYYWQFVMPTTALHMLTLALLEDKVMGVFLKTPHLEKSLRKD